MYLGGFSPDSGAPIPLSCNCLVRTEWVVAGMDDHSGHAARKQVKSQINISRKADSPVISVKAFNRDFGVSFPPESLEFFSPLDKKNVLAPVRSSSARVSSSRWVSMR